MSKTYRPRHRHLRPLDAPSLARCTCRGPFKYLCPCHEAHAYALLQARHRGDWRGARRAS